MFIITQARDTIPGHTGRTIPDYVYVAGSKANPNALRTKEAAKFGGWADRPDTEMTPRLLSPQTIVPAAEPFGYRRAGFRVFGLKVP